MICETCHGYGYVPVRYHTGAGQLVETSRSFPCPQDGCYNGYMHCCEGGQEQVEDAGGKKAL